MRGIFWEKECKSSRSECKEDILKSFRFEVKLHFLSTARNSYFVRTFLGTLNFLINFLGKKKLRYPLLNKISQAPIWSSVI
jgi:hypothetical protein